MPRHTSLVLVFLVWWGGGLAGLVFWSCAHLSLGFEGVAGCWLVCTSSHCRQWERPIELAIFGRLFRSWTLLPSLVFCIYYLLGLFPRKYFVVLKAIFVSKSFDFLDFCCLKPFSICYILSISLRFFEDSSQGLVHSTVFIYWYVMSFPFFVVFPFFAS